MKKNRIIWFVFWVASIIILSFYGGVLSFSLFYFLTFIPIICVLYCFFVLYNVKLYQNIETRNVTAKQGMKYYFQIINESFMSFSAIRVYMYDDFSYIKDVPEDIQFELNPREVFCYETELVCKYRGEYPVGIAYIEVTDFLNLFAIKQKPLSTLSVIVNPYIDTEEASLLREVVYAKDENPYSKDEPDCIVSPYQMGDSFRRIHWKATAASNSLKVRNLCGEQERMIQIYFDTSRETTDPNQYIPMENDMLEEIIKLVYGYLFNQIPVRVVYMQEQLEEIVLFNMTEFQDFYDRICNVSFRKNYDVNLGIQNSMQSQIRLHMGVLELFLFQKTSDMVESTIKNSYKDYKVSLTVI